MPTWEEIQQHARSKFTLQDDEDGYFGLVFGYDSGRSHKIFVRRFEAFDMDWLEFRATVCKGSEMAHAVALRKNLNFSVGALALDGDDDYVLIHNAPLGTMDMVEFELPLSIVARTADELEQQFAAETDKW